MDGAIPLLPLNTFRARAANVLPDIGYWRGGWIGDSADWAIYRTEADWAIYITIRLCDLHNKPIGRFTEQKPIGRFTKQKPTGRFTEQDLRRPLRI